MDNPVDDSRAERQGDRRWRRGAEIATIVAVPVAIIGVIIAALAWRDPVPPGTAAGPGASTTSQSTGASPTQPPTAAERQLSELIPKSGQSNIKVEDDPNGSGRIITIRCGSGASDDRYREVAYSLNGAYREFRADAVATVSGPELKTQLEVFGDDILQANVVLFGVRPAAVQAPVDSKKTMRLRLTCANGDATLTLRNARVRA